MASGLLGHLRCLQTKPAFCSFTTRQPLPARRQHSCAALPGDDFESTSDDVQSLPVAENSGRVSPDGNRTEALIKSLQEISSKQGRKTNRTNLVLGTDRRLEAWRQVDKKVNKYPGKRVFKAVGEGGDNFASSMQAAVEQTLGPVQPDKIQHRLSSQQSYISITIGPVTVDNSNQVVEVYTRMKKDSRLRFCIIEEQQAPVRALQEMTARQDHLFQAREKSKTNSKRAMCSA